MRFKRNFYIAVVVFFMMVQHLGAQIPADLRINEILVFNDSNYIDDFGKHSPWIELFNTAYNTVDAGGLFLTDDLADPTKYPIIKGQSLTRIPMRSYTVFWADNEPTQGILHLNFTLEPGKTIALFEANGRTLIDSVTIPLQIEKDVSYGRAYDGSPEWKFLEKTTPHGNNNTESVETSGDQFLKFDPSGAGMAIIAMTVVFSGLAALFILFKFTGRLLARDYKKQARSRSLVHGNGLIHRKEKEGKGHAITGEVSAAIAITLHLYASELHDTEKTVLTINKVSRTYSPWSSKIYGLRKSPK